MFKPNSAELLDEYKGKLNEAGELLKEHESVNITIEGHTASTGKPDFEMKLSEERAGAVRDYLVNNFGIETSRIKVIGYGSTKPVADNDTPEGKAKNRRIEYEIEYGAGQKSERRTIS
ncbi:MAG: OmpA family protein [Candidatus Coatesbacteria bacterium]|nr:MAG: OmpA family protein [Candidatus Coatesbacteria bacterium]